MIALVRDRSPRAVHKNFRGAKRIEFNVELLRQEIDVLDRHQDNRKFDSSRWKYAKDQLFTETGDKCAYCEAHTRAVAHGDVEHYRPKSDYWWLAYCYENYLVSCAVCNQIHKKDKFPIQGLAMRGPDPEAFRKRIPAFAANLNPDPLQESAGLGYNDFKQVCDQEGALLLNPYYHDPEAFIAYSADDLLQEVAVTAATEEARPVVEASVVIYGLNRTELLSLRYYVFSIYDTLWLTLKDPGISNATRRRAEDEIGRMTHSSSQFAGMVRYFERIRGNS
ncbi:HNH endonuclease [Salmonirosea aquatica]|uniref:TIGR02646 family protein n=1 Tax=Salmonirosea aquatica TaxID=2654236 RepID=A0A7C9BEC1_9BACT|nr:hypothetical protein [Cytophagaceae bacterium SJW1-29]